MRAGRGARGKETLILNKVSRATIQKRSKPYHCHDEFLDVTPSRI